MAAVVTCRPPAARCYTYAAANTRNVTARAVHSFPGAHTAHHVTHYSFHCASLCLFCLAVARHCKELARVLYIEMRGRHLLTTSRW